MPEELDEQPGLRSFWSGAITFGLVSVPVALYAANRPRGVGMRMVAPDDAPVQRRYVCSKDEQPLDGDEIVRGYEIEKGKFVVVTDDELDAIAPRKSREIDLRLFVDRDAIDPMYYERAWFLVPSGGTNKAYRLLAEVMERKQQAGIATFVMRAKEYLVAILAENGILRAETLRFHNELRTPDDVGLPSPAKVPAAESKKFETQIGRRTKKLDLREFLDEHAERLEKLVKKRERQGDHVLKLAEERDVETQSGGEVVDLMAILSRSLGESGRRPAKKAAARPARRSAKTAAARKK